MKKLLLVLIIILLSPPSLLVGYNLFADEALDSALLNYKDAALPEEVSDNAAVDLAVIMRPEDVSMEKAIQRIGWARSSYDLFNPAANKPIYPDIIPATEETPVDLPVFKGLPQMFYCWITLSGKYDMCLQDFAVNQVYIKNGLYMTRYEDLLKKENFAGDAVVNLPQSFVSIALLHMAKTSKVFSDGEQDQAFQRWKEQHQALQRFMTGSHHLMAMGQVMQVYRLSLLLLERMLYLGLEPRFYNQIEAILSPEGMARVNVDGILRADVGFNVRRVLHIYRPTGVRILNTGYHWLVPRQIRASLNVNILPVLEKYQELQAVASPNLLSQAESYQSLTLGADEQEKDGDNDGGFTRAAEAARQIGVYLVSGVHLLPQIYDLEAREKALILAMKQRQENIAPAEVENWLGKQESFYNPHTAAPFEFKNEPNRAIVFTNSAGEEIPTYLIPVE